MRFYRQTLGALCIGDEMVDAAIVQCPEISPVVGHCKGQRAEVHRQGIIDLLPRVPVKIRQMAVAIQSPLRLVGIFPCERLALQRTALQVFALQCPSLLLLLLCQVPEAVAAHVEHKIVFVNLTKHLFVGQQRDVADAIGLHVAAVTHSRLKCTKLIAIIATQTIPCGKPHESLLVL